MSPLEGTRDFLSDLFNRQVLVLKCVYFLLMAAIVILWPQFTIHQKTLGLTEYQTGITSLAVSVLSICYPFFSGIAGDKVGNFRILMAIISMATGVIALLFTWIPSSAVQMAAASNVSDAAPANLSSESSIPSPNATVGEVDGSRQALTFWVYIVIRTSYGVCNGATFILFDAAVMANVQESGISFGYQRAWGTVGAVVSSYLSGVIVEKTGGFNEIFYASAALQMAAGILMLRVRIDYKVPAASLTKDLLLHCFKAEVLLFFGAIAAAGMFIGYIETFMYRYLFALGATPVLIGLTVTIGAPFEFVLTLITSYFTNLVGHPPIIVFGLLAYAVRYLGFSYLQDPWWVLPLEILESVANGLLFTSAIMYCTVLFPTETIASFRGVLGILYFGIGRLVGVIVGSEIRERLGHRITFRIWACTAVACATFYFLASSALKKSRSRHFSVNDMVQGREETKNNKGQSGIDNQAWDVYS
ncbi:major facilitator superfamily domain-containing protein 6-like [Macrobrachium rosenbergii]|uniref:major facilitator superfamily domain-containing protein 6-like n=1 Tax=Macrobrachium rosenbergii TaxID=79674 RepID=UPI0034D3FA64